MAESQIVESSHEADNEPQSYHLVPNVAVSVPKLPVVSEVSDYVMSMVKVNPESVLLENVGQSDAVVNEPASSLVSSPESQLVEGQEMGAISVDSVFPAEPGTPQESVGLSISADHSTTNLAIMEPSALINLYLLSISLTYLWAFSSLYFQVPGLYGDNGLMPVRSVLKCEFRNQSQCAFGGDTPTILHLFVSAFQLSPSMSMEFTCILGIVLSALSTIFRPFRDCATYGILWYLYFSCFQVGQTFLWFQWDTLLLETGFLTILVAPSRLFRRAILGKDAVRWLPSDNVTLFLIRWLAFRLMFASGVVKLTSQCQTWWGLTALHYHFESQCIPTWPAWYAHVWSPDWFKKLSVVATYVIEIFIPAAFFLAPVRRLRQIAFWSEVLLMVNIMITGNYNFFNAITIFVCAPLIVHVDGHSNFGSHKLKSIIGRRLYGIIAGLLTMVGVGYVAHWTVECFGLRWDSKNLAIESEITFTKREYNDILGSVTSKLLVFGSLAFVAEVVAALIRCFTDIRARGFFGFGKRVSILFHCIIVCGLAATMFAISLVPISWVHRDANSMLWPELTTLQKKTDRYQLTHGYGLFRSMTGVGGRPEVVVEGAASIDGPWKEYEFLYKPGSLDGRPPFISPHQARLDWQMWFAALDSFQRNPWFTCMMYRLLRSERDVLKLMDINKVPFGGKNPAVKYVRAQAYLYHFTTDKKADKQFDSKNWWWREYQHEYFPIFSLEKTDWIDWLKESGCIVEKTKRKRGRVGDGLLFLRDMTDLFTRAEYFVWFLTSIVIVVLVIKAKVVKKNSF